ncbi:MAG: AAA family ATPase [Candidatus Desantisbacteria bacterium]
MYNSFRIKHFRCFEDLEVENIRQINLITGLNNVGKTALLEALLLHCKANSWTLRNLNTFRGLTEFTEWGLPRMEQLANLLRTNLFFGLDTSRNVELEGTLDKGEKRLLRFSMLPREDNTKGQDTGKLISEEYPCDELKIECIDEGTPVPCKPQETVIIKLAPLLLFPSYFMDTRSSTTLSEIANQFGNMEIKNQQDLLTETLKIIEPKLQRIAMITRGGIPILHGDIGSSELMPLHVMGDGMVRICSIILAIANAPDGIILIDEVENGLHHSVLKKFWTAVGNISRRFNTQMFATTHSYECISAAHEAFSENQPDDFCLYRLERIKGKIKAIAYGQKSLEFTIENRWEIR